ncbi:hypothetical protein KYTH15_09830 [Helicobacter pylori]
MKSKTSFFQSEKISLKPTGLKLKNQRNSSNDANRVTTISFLKIKEIKQGASPTRLI